MLKEKEKQMIINIELIKSLNPCECGYKNLIKHYPDFSGSEIDFLNLENIPHEDKLWIILRENFIPENDLHELACVFAERVLPIFERELPKDLRPRKAIEAKRKWIKKEITSVELAAAGSAVGSAARDAVWSAVGPAARDAEERFQLDHLIKYFKGKNK